MTDDIHVSSDAITIADLTPMMVLHRTATLYDGEHDEQTRQEVYARLIALLRTAEPMVLAGGVVDIEPLARADLGYMLTVPVTIRVSERQVAELLEGVQI